MRLFLGLASLAAIIGLAVPAHADPGQDASFLSQLSQAGITYNNGPAAVAAARTACKMMDAGQGQMDVIKQVMSLNPGFGLAGSTRFTAIASAVYCPDYLSKSSGKTNNSGFPGLPGLDTPFHQCRKPGCGDSSSSVPPTARFAPLINWPIVGMLFGFAPWIVY